jgi:hypothetical protein
MDEMSEFLRTYIECALWSSVDPGSDIPLDSIYEASDLPGETVEKMRADCADFQESNARLLAQAYATGYTESQAGHDFWLTRNGHGAGFWDRGLGATGEALTRDAKVHGSVDLYIGDDGKVYQQ